MTEFKEVAHLYLGCDWQWTQYSGEHETGIYGTSLFNSFLLREISLGNGVAKPKGFDLFGLIESGEAINSVK